MTESDGSVDFRKKSIPLMTDYREKPVGGPFLVSRTGDAG